MHMHQYVFRCAPFEGLMASFYIVTTFVSVSSIFCYVFVYTIAIVIHRMDRASR
jgi:hypothetical protein